MKAVAAVVREHEQWESSQKKTSKNTFAGGKD